MIERRRLPRGARRLPLAWLLGPLALAACSEAATEAETAAGPAKAEDFATTATCSQPPGGAVRIDGGSFKMGQQGVYPEEGPVREVRVDTFWIDPHEVTNAQFARFVEQTGYVTLAEKPVDAALYGVPKERISPELLLPGSAVFTPPAQPSTRYTDWWKYVPGASWTKPYGPQGPEAVPLQPVVHLVFEDMQAYAAWAGGRLPSEAEWEYAAAAGKAPNVEQPGKDEANTWEGVFPMANTGGDAFKGIAPVGCYSPNANGLYDMVGNVWEVTADFYRPGHDPNDRDNPAGPAEREAFDPQNPQYPSRVIKGGSYLCAPNYCQRYRPAARQGRDPALGASNVGFRLAYDAAPEA